MMSIDRMGQKAFNLEQAIKRFDPRKVGLSIAAIPNQISDAAQQFRSQVTVRKRAYNHVIFCAMGGSALGADFIRSVYADYLKVPITIVNGYTIPKYANQKSLVIVCSYSGTTEEVVACFTEARKRKLPLFVITSNGILARQATTYRVPSFVFQPRYNPSGYPRIGASYMMVGLYLLLKKFGLIRAGAEDLIVASKRIPNEQKQVYALARKLVGRRLLIVAAEHLLGAAHVMSNSLNETAKVFAPYFPIPELNHHLLEGVGGLRSDKAQWTALLLESNLYYTRNRKRLAVTADVFERIGLRVEVIECTGTKVEQALKAFFLGSFLSYYLALLTNVNPAKIPWVDYFKKRMK